MSLLAVVTSQNHSNTSIHYLLNVFNKLVKFKIITPLKLNEAEWYFPGCNGSCQNIRATNIFKEKTGEIIDICAFNAKNDTIYDIKEDEFRINPNSNCWSTTLYEYKNKTLTGRYFRRCKIIHDERGEYLPKDCITIPCTEINYATYDYIMCVEENSPQLAKLEKEYDIIWQYDFKLDGVEFKDFTKEIIDHEQNY